MHTSGAFGTNYTGSDQHGTPEPCFPCMLISFSLSIKQSKRERSKQDRKLQHLYLKRNK